MGRLAQYQYSDSKKSRPWPMKVPAANMAVGSAKVWGFVEKKFQGEVITVGPYRKVHGAVIRGKHSFTQASVPDDGLAIKFEQLATQWKEETMFLSSITDKAIHPYYQRIIGLGPDVIPLILDSLRKKGGHWYWALQSITGENPVLPEHYGDISNMKNDWVMWGIRKGYIK